MVKIPHIRIPSVRVGGIDPTSDIGTAIGGVQPTPITYLTQWKIVGNSEVKTLPYPDGVVLPNGYKRCSYLASDGTAYIELSFGFNETDEMYAKVKFNEKYLYERHIISTKQWNTDTNRFCFGVYNSNFAVALGDISTPNGEFTPNAPSNLDVCEVSYSNNQFTLINEGNTFVCDLNNANFGSESAHICLLKNYNDLGTNGEIYEYRHKRGNTEYRLIPCLDNNDTPCMYDVINNQAYYNSAGSGSFTYELYPQPTEIWSCGEYSETDNKYHIVVLPLGKSPVDIALDKPLRKVNDVADTIEFPSGTDGKALVTRNIKSVKWSDFNIIYQEENVRFATITEVGDIFQPTDSSERLTICLSVDFVQSNAALNTTGLDMCMVVYTNRKLYIKDYSIDTSSMFQNKYGNHELLYKLATPTTELVDAPQIEEAETYSCIISQGAKAVEWSSFITESDSE